MIDILPIALFFLLVWKMKPVRPISGFQENYLSIDTGKALRGFFALAVVFHHLAQLTGTGRIFHRFTHIGYLSVAVFFFLSGYGLQKSHMNSPQYRERFLSRRLPSVLLPYLVVTGLYWLMNSAFGRIFSIKDIFLRLLDGDPIASYSWYVVTILLFYIAFWLMMRLCGDHYKRMLLCGLAWELLYTAFCIKIGYGFWWYNASQLLIVGMFWAVFENRILNVLKRLYPLLFPITGICFLLSFACAETLPSLLLPGENSLLFTALAAILFPICVLFFTLKFQVGNRILNFLGNLSLEIYLLHGLFIEIPMPIQNEFLWCCSVLICTIACASVFHMVFQKISRRKTPVSR